MTEVPLHSAGLQTNVTVYVCTTCRRHSDAADAPRVGAELAAATDRAAENSGIVVQPVRCLANCKRGCTVAMRCNGAWLYVFGQLEPSEADAQAVILGAQLLSTSTDGLMPWRGRPDALKRGLIARIPPIGFVPEENE